MAVEFRGQVGHGRARAGYRHARHFAGHADAGRVHDRHGPPAGGLLDKEGAVGFSAWQGKKQAARPQQPLDSRQHAVQVGAGYMEQAVEGEDGVE